MKILVEVIAGHVESKTKNKMQNAVKREKDELALPPEREHFIQKKTVIT